MVTDSQGKMILRYLETHSEGITPAEAYQRYGIMRLAARIWDLRNTGHNILRKDEYKYNADGKVEKTWARYYLVK